jgi:hypothetical protein
MCFKNKRFSTIAAARVRGTPRAVQVCGVWRQVQVQSGAQESFAHPCRREATSGRLCLSNKVPVPLEGRERYPPSLPLSLSHVV